MVTTARSPLDAFVRPEAPKHRTARVAGSASPVSTSEAAGTAGTAGTESAAWAPIEPTVDVSVLVPVLNEETHLAESVAAMLAQDLGGTFELLFVDGRSTDRTVPLLKAMRADDPRIRILDNPDRTTAHALNVGLRAARGRFVARMDAHTAYPAGYLRRGIERLERGDVDWVTGPQVPVGRGPWSQAVTRALSGGLGRGVSDKWREVEGTTVGGPDLRNPAAADATGRRPAEDGDATGADDHEWELTTSVFTGVWRRSTLDQLGGWDGGWPVNQDSEMAARVLAGGGRIVCLPAMGAHYTPRDSWRGLARQYRRYGSFRARTFLRHPSSCGPLRLAAASLPLVLASAALPAPIGLPGRVVALGYALAIIVQIARLRPPLRDAPRLVVALVTMHVAWGAGFLRGLVRWLPQRRRLRAAWPAPLVRPDAAASAAACRGCAGTTSTTSTGDRRVLA